MKRNFELTTHPSITDLKEIIDQADSHKKQLTSLVRELITLDENRKILSPNTNSIIEAANRITTSDQYQEISEEYRIRKSLQQKVKNEIELLQNTLSIAEIYYHQLKNQHKPVADDELLVAELRIKHLQENAEQKIPDWEKPILLTVLSRLKYFGIPDFKATYSKQKILIPQLETALIEKANSLNLNHPVALQDDNENLQKIKTNVQYSISELNRVAKDIDHSFQELIPKIKQQFSQYFTLLDQNKLEDSEADYGYQLLSELDNCIESPISSQKIPNPWMEITDNIANYRDQLLAIATELRKAYYDLGKEQIEITKKTIPDETTQQEKIRIALHKIAILLQQYSESEIPTLIDQKNILQEYIENSYQQGTSKHLKSIIHKNASRKNLSIDQIYETYKELRINSLVNIIDSLQPKTYSYILDEGPIAIAEILDCAVKAIELAPSIESISQLENEIKTANNFQELAIHQQTIIEWRDQLADFMKSHDHFNQFMNKYENYICNLSGAFSELKELNPELFSQYANPTDKDQIKILNQHIIDINGPGSDHSNPDFESIHVLKNRLMQLTTLENLIQAQRNELEEKSYQTIGMINTIKDYAANPPDLKRQDIEIIKLSDFKPKLDQALNRNDIGKIIHFVQKTIEHQNDYAKTISQMTTQLNQQIHNLKKLDENSIPLHEKNVLDNQLNEQHANLLQETNHCTHAIEQSHQALQLSIMAAKKMITEELYDNVSIIKSNQIRINQLANESTKEFNDVDNGPALLSNYDEQIDRYHKISTIIEAQFSNVKNIKQWCDQFDISSPNIKEINTHLTNQKNDCDNLLAYSKNQKEKILTQEMTHQRQQLNEIKNSFNQLSTAQIQQVIEMAYQFRQYIHNDPTIQNEVIWNNTFQYCENLLPKVKAMLKELTNLTELHDNTSYVQEIEQQKTELYEKMNTLLYQLKDHVSFSQSHCSNQQALPSATNIFRFKNTKLIDIILKKQIALDPNRTSEQIDAINQSAVQLVSNQTLSQQLQEVGIHLTTNEIDLINRENRQIAYHILIKNPIIAELAKNKPIKSTTSTGSSAFLLKLFGRQSTFDAIHHLNNTINAPVGTDELRHRLQKIGLTVTNEQLALIQQKNNELRATSKSFSNDKPSSPWEYAKHHPVKISAGILASTLIGIKFVPFIALAIAGVKAGAIIKGSATVASGLAISEIFRHSDKTSSVSEVSVDDSHTPQPKR